MQQLSVDLTCHVVELADPYEVIRGEDWLSKYSATLSWAHKCCVLTKGSQRITLVPDVHSQDEPAQSSSGAFAAPMSAVQANRAMLHGCCAYFAVCTDAQTPVDASCAPVQVDSACSNVDKSQLMPESDLNGLLHEFSDRFMDTLPEGLPPERNIGAFHTLTTRL